MLPKVREPSDQLQTAACAGAQTNLPTYFLSFGTVSNTDTLFFLNILLD